MHKRIAWIMLPVIVCLMIRCSSHAPVAGGGTSEQGNARVIAAAVMREGAPVAGATVRIRATDLLAEAPNGPAKRMVNSVDLVTDSQGRFVSDTLDPGEYSIEVTDLSDGAVLMNCDLESEADTLDLGIQSLKPFASIAGTVTPDSSSGAMIARIYGLERSVPVDPVSGTYSFQDLPEGSFTIRLEAASDEYGAGILQTAEIASGAMDTLAPVVLARFEEEEYVSWKHSKTVRFNTTTEGGAISRDVIRFPVLIRLSAADVSFSEAHEQGHDIRFSKSDGTRLRYEIEHWDARAQRAAVWVLMDTIRANDSTQSIRMHWGRDNPQDFSTSAAVFAAADGYAGVWHLSGTARDATANGNSGAVYGCGFSRGAIGRAAMFDNVDDYIEVPHHSSLNLDSGDFTISMNVLHQSTDTVDQLLRKSTKPGGEGSYEVQLFHGRPGGWLIDSVSAQRKVFGAAAGAVLNAGQWNHIAIVRNADSLRVYLNGAQDRAIRWGTENVNSTGPLLFGKDIRLPTEMFGGQLDEIRIVRTARSADWIKLCTENQKADSRLIRFE